MNDLAGKAKSFWDRKEGTAGYVMMGGLIFFLLYLFNKYGDSLSHMMDNALNISISLACIAFVAWIATNKRVHRVLELAMFWLTGIFIEMNPLLVMDEYLNSLEEDKEQMSTK